MQTWILLAVVVVVLALAMNALQPKKKLGKKCMSCPERRYCGGNRPRCARRNETV